MTVLFIGAFAVFIGIVLLVLVTKSPLPSHVQLVPPEEDFEKRNEFARLTEQQVFDLGEKLLKDHGLTIKEKLKQSDDEYYWIAESKNTFFFGNYVVAFLFPPEANPLVKMSNVLELKDFIKSVGGGKGFLLTNGYFTRDVFQPLEGPAVSLFNATKCREQLQA